MFNIIKESIEGLIETKEKYEFNKILKDIKSYGKYEYRCAYEILGYADDMPKHQRKILFDIVAEKEEYLIEFMCKGKPNKEEIEYILKYIIDKEALDKDTLYTKNLRDVFVNTEYIKFALKYIEENNMKISDKIVNAMLSRVVKYDNGKRCYDKEVVELLINRYEMAIKLVMDIYQSLDSEQIERIYNMHKEKILEEKQNVSVMYRICEIFHKQIDSKYLLELTDKMCEILDIVHGELILQNMHRFKLTEDEKDIIESKIILIKLAL